VTRTLKRPAAWIALAVLAFFLLAAADLGLRAKGALGRAKQHAAWRDVPSLKAEHFGRLHSLRSAAIKAEAAAGKLTAEQAARAESLAAAEKDFLISESSAKQAVIWYRSAAEDFPSPFNLWAKEARRELPGALAAWRAQLEAKGIKTEDWMLQ
jgi:hypothetical protein